MLREHKKTILILCSGLILGGMAGHFRAKMRFNAAGGEAEPAVFHEQTFAQASSIDSALMLAQQLPLADAQKCAALAQAMLSKRVRLLVMQDPFDDDPEEKYEEKPLPTHVWEGLFKRWFQVAPQAAWAFVLAHHRDDDLPLREVALRQWALLDPLAAVKAAGEGISSDEQLAIVESCIEEWPLIGLNLLVEWKEGLRDAAADKDPFSSRKPDCYQLMNVLLQKFAEQSPREALEFCQRHEPYLISYVCMGWMREDAAACLSWIRELPIVEQKGMLADMCQDRDVNAQIIRQLASLCTTEQISKHIEVGLIFVARRDVSLAQSLINELLSNPTDRILARCRIAREIIESDPRRGLAFVLPSLREPLPLKYDTSLRYYDAFSDFPVTAGYESNRSPDLSAISSVLAHYLQLGPAAGIEKSEVLQFFQDIHPQYYDWLIGNNMGELKALLGEPTDWLTPYLEKLSREEIQSVADGFGYGSPEEVQAAMAKVAPGKFRDVLADEYFSQLIDREVPLEVVIAEAKAYDGQLDWSGLYPAWLKRAPDEALSHLMANERATENDWEESIQLGYATHADQLESAVEKLPKGALRDSAVQDLSTASMQNKKDVVTSLYWATEIQNTAERYRQMRRTWQLWENDQGLRQHPQVIKGIRQNLENSGLDAREKASWLERLESEVLR